MKPLLKGIPVIYSIILMLNLYGHYVSDIGIISFSKALLMPLLAFWWVISSKDQKWRQRIYVLLALFFCWLGDLMLLFDTELPIMFLLGLASFFIGHIFYIVQFNTSRAGHTTSTATFMGILIMNVFGFAFVYLLWPYLDELKFPVIGYAIILMAMVISALLRSRSNNYTIILMGALLFVASDSLLAYNKFIEPFQNAPYLVMTTYGLAQLLIIYGETKGNQFVISES